MDIRDRVFLITGGGSGLGAAAARALAAQGGRVMLADVAEGPGMALAAELGAAARFVRTDVTDAGQAEAAVATARAAFGGLHGLVNCAGIVLARRCWDATGRHRSSGSHG